ncbi:hypothetical protein HK100_005192 [Physocladia obscura]|uniref:Uncharacterized protein n=1 Tax=Physocladia obscura TaxID=109957 RepID=A0AAD5SSU0_9FUNG|nr:hypothetical protein HK100_005192 [Physocladia obscura]
MGEIETDGESDKPPLPTTTVPITALQQYKSNLCTIPYEIIVLVLQRLTALRVALVLSTCRHLRLSIELHVFCLWPASPTRFMSLAATGNLAMLEAHAAWRRAQESTYIQHHQHQHHTDGFILPALLTSAAEGGYVSLVPALLRMHSTILQPTSELIEAAAAGGHVQMLDFLLVSYPKIFASDSDSEAGGISFSRLWLDKAVIRAATNGHLAVLHWLLGKSPSLSLSRSLPISPAAFSSAVDSAAEHGHHPVLLFLLVFYQQTFASLLSSPSRPINKNLCSIKALDGAAKFGCLDTVKLLHRSFGAPCSTNALDQAAGHGHLQVVKYLHKHYKQGCTPKALDFAALRGHFDVVKFLHENRKEGCTSDALNYAASRGNLKIVQFLIKCRSEGRISEALRFAQRAGHSSVVAFLSNFEKRRT